MIDHAKHTINIYWVNNDRTMANMCNENEWFDMTFNSSTNDSNNDPCKKYASNLTKDANGIAWVFGKIEPSTQFARLFLSSGNAVRNRGSAEISGLTSKLTNSQTVYRSVPNVRCCANMIASLSVATSTGVFGGINIRTRFAT